MIRRQVLILAMLLSLVPLFGQGLDGADAGLMIYDLDANSPVYGRNADVKLTPASVMKLFTTATALEMFGGDKVLQTVVATDGTIQDGVLRGNIYVIGALDPTMESSIIEGESFFANLVTKLRSRGVRRVEGDIIADGGIIRAEAASPKWVLEDLATYYGVGCFGLSAYDNVQKFTIRTGSIGSQPRYTFEFREAQYKVIDRLRIIKSQGSGVYLYQIPYGEELLVEGEMAAGTSRQQPVTITNPPLFIARRCFTQLADSGISVTGTGREGEYDSSVTLDTIYVHSSPILARIVKETNYRSNNHYAEHLFRLIGTNRVSRGATRHDSESELKRFWKARGLDLSRLALYDGNGLSPMDAATPAMVVGLLRQMWAGEYAYFFRQSLPECGSEGTVKSMFRTAGFDARAKSGSMTGVQAYAGYITSHGRNYAFCVIVNEFDVTRAKLRAEIERLITQEIEKYESTLIRN